MLTLQNMETQKKNASIVSLCPKPKKTKMQLLLFLLVLLVFLKQSLNLNTLSQNLEVRYLQQLKLGLSDPTQCLSSWNDQDETPCNWYGITCDSVTHRVTSVNLTNSQLGGPFPILLCHHLPYLSSVFLSNNSINSSLTDDHDHDDISTCQNLTQLHLSRNLFVGPIPETLSQQLPNLVLLDLAGNNFSGEIPASFGTFRRLETLSLGANLLSGKIPSSLGNISTLKELALGFNSFSTRIPSQLGNLSNLENLWLHNAGLVGPIPASLGQLSRLTNLDLSMNKLTGSIPSSLTELKSIVHIELYHNFLSGELPANMSRMTTLRRFDSSMNELTGTIPTELCELQLESLNLSENRLEGRIAEIISRSQNLYELKLYNNTLSGEIPSQLGMNSALQRVDLSYNQLHGEIPKHLCEKSVLEDLNLMHNSFSGNIPDNLGQCKSLIWIRLKHNNFGGSVPEGFWGLPNVYLIDLSENWFSGRISRMIFGAQNLSVLLLSNNWFDGSIPKTMVNLTQLNKLDLSHNELSGGIPKTMVNLKQLNKLDLSHNELSGGIPEGIQGWKNLNKLNLANNNFSGQIPNEIGSLPVLNYLDLSSNYFSTEIPLELQNLKLSFLNLSNNRLSGELPPLYAKEIYRNSFVGNPGLCGDLAGLCPKMDESKNQGYLWILISIFILGGVVGVVWFYFKYQDSSKTEKRIPKSKWKSFHKIGFSEHEIVDRLKEENVIGSGASGKVFKVLLSNGEVVAVKKLGGRTRKDDTIVDSYRDEFEVEVETLGKIRHKNIVRLWCCCNAGDCKLLVYEYVPYGSLGDLLHCAKGGMLDFPTRYKIALDAAEGLSYLHHDCVPPIVHRDVKSKNILLDAEFNAKVADFGVAKVVEGVGNGAESMSGIAGSCGYIAPEYAYTLRVNEKSDIYSFGVVILELVTGRLPIDQEFGEKDLVRWVCSTLDQKGLDHVIDPKLDSSYKEEIYGVLKIGLLCTTAFPINRPSMRKVVKMLQEVGAVKVQEL